jgi:PAS domain S-box-containing protein
VLHRDAEGRPLRVLESNTDVTARRRAEEALRESEERFQAMANGIQQLAWMAEADGHIFWYNQRWYEYTGTTFEQMQGWGWQSVHDAAMLPKVLEGWKGSIASGKPFDMEFPLRGADGCFRMFLTRVMPVRDLENRVVRWFGTNTDISERNQTEERLAGLAQELAGQAKDLARSRDALETQTLMLRSVLDSIEEGLVAADEQGKFIIWNPAAAKILGLGATNLPSQEWTAHYGLYLEDTVTPFPPDQIPLVRAIRGETSTTQMYVRNRELEKGAWVEVYGGPLRDKNGAMRGGVVALRDVTQKRADEREIRKLNEELEERVIQRTAQLAAANQELEAFTYSVSHDLRAPLRHIGGFSKILVEDFGSAMDPEARCHLQRIQDGTHRMGLLVDELLNLARVGRHALKIQPAGLNSIVEEVISLLQPEAEGRAITWKIAQLPSVECDPILIKQVFQNLIANAIKFTRPRESAVIEIDYRQENGETVFFVRDNGVGFNMKYTDKLFGVFQRLHRAEDFEGTGIGLATVQRIIRKHGGRVWAKAELDKGATFYFTVGAEPADIKNKTATAAGA